eukprot:m.124165 g.124165  ORF g.124165 m.124165 type:complete len:304 (+) comp15695_c0_seq1:1252-2163(+)
MVQLLAVTLLVGCCSLSHALQPSMDIENGNVIINTNATLLINARSASIDMRRLAEQVQSLESLRTLVEQLTLQDSEARVMRLEKEVERNSDTIVTLREDVKLLERQREQDRERILNLEKQVEIASAGMAATSDWITKLQTHFGFPAGTHTIDTIIDSATELASWQQSSYRIDPTQPKVECSTLFPQYLDAGDSGVSGFEPALTLINLFVNWKYNHALPVDSFRVVETLGTLTSRTLWYHSSKHQLRCESDTLWPQRERAMRRSSCQQVQYSRCTNPCHSSFNHSWGSHSSCDGFQRGWCTRPD